MKKYIILATAMLFLAAPLVSHSGAEKETPALKPADVIVGLGFGPASDKQGKPSAELARRVEKAVELYKAGLAPNMIFTGANTGAGCEAEVMEEVAVKMGVPADKIFTETRATDTITNAKYSVAIMKQHGWKSAILVSNPYHVHRGKWLFDSNPGIDIQTADAKTPVSPLYHLATLTHEGIAWAGYAFGHVREKAKAP